MAKVIQVRLESELKDGAESILEELGMDLPTAIRVFLKKVIKTKSIPFTISSINLTENGFTPEFENIVLKASADKHKAKGFDNADDLMIFLNNYRDENNTK